ncbi:hypothetical protein C7212DRAFT_309247, partial [Tuber magnatum]
AKPSGTLFLRPEPPALASAVQRSESSHQDHHQDHHHHHHHHDNRHNHNHNQPAKA